MGRKQRHQGLRKLRSEAHWPVSAHRKNGPAYPGAVTCHVSLKGYIIFISAIFIYYLYFISSIFIYYLYFISTIFIYYLYFISAHRKNRPIIFQYGRGRNLLYAVNHTLLDILSQISWLGTDNIYYLCIVTYFHYLLLSWCNR